MFRLADRRTGLFILFISLMFLPAGTVVQPVLYAGISATDAEFPIGPSADDPLSSAYNDAVNLTGKFNKSEYRGVNNDEYRKFSVINGRFDNILGFYGSIDLFGYAEMDSSRHVSGNNSVKITVKNYALSPVTNYIRQYYYNPLPNIDKNATLSLNWFIEQMDSFDNDTDMFYVQISLNNSRRLEYFMGGMRSYTPLNVFSLKVDNADTRGAWFYLRRNITEDYISRFGAFTGDVGISYIYVLLIQARYTGNSCVVYIDNMSLYIDSTDIINNGDFEVESVNGGKLPQGWYVTDYTPGKIKASSFSSKNDTSVLLASEVISYRDSVMTSSRGELGVSLGNYGCMEVSENHTVTANFDYYIANTPENNTYSAYILIRLYNGTDYRYIYITLLDGGWGVPGNSSTNINIVLGGNSTGVWYHVEFNLWDYAGLLFSSGTVRVNSLTLGVYQNGYDNETVEIYIENHIIKTTDFYDPDFEHPNTLNIAAGGWSISNLDTSYINDASSGKYAVNFSFGGTISGSASEYYTGKILEPELCFGFDYKIMNWSDPSENDGTVLTLVLYSLNSSITTEYKLSYIMASAIIPVINGSTTAYYILDSYNAFGLWIAVRRNIYNDFKAAFPDIGEDFYIFTVTLSMNKDYNSPNFYYVYLDNLFWASDLPAVKVVYDPTIPSYHTDLKIIAYASDSGTEQPVLNLFYSLNGTWNKVTMTPEDPSEQKYTYTIPADRFSYNDTMSYYITAEDSAGNSVVFPENGAADPLTVVIGDTVPPDVAEYGFITPPIENQPSKIYANVHDDGSGISSVLFFYSVNGGNWNNISLTDNGDGQYTSLFPAYPDNTVIMYYVIAEDAEGNSVNTSISGGFDVIAVGSALTKAELFFIGMGVMGVIISGSVITYKIMKIRRLRKREIGPENDEIEKTGSTDL